jgi:hypothetical protein
MKSSNPYYHLFYWIIVVGVLVLTFGFSWDNNLAAFFFVCMLLPVVLGTSYFFNYNLVSKLLLRKRYFKFALYSLYTFIVSLYLESIVLLFSLVYLGKFSFSNLAPNASDPILLTVVLYLLVFVGSFLLMIFQINENQKVIRELSSENEKMKKSFLEIVSSRKVVKIPYSNIVYI